MCRSFKVHSFRAILFLVNPFNMFQILMSTISILFSWQHLCLPILVEAFVKCHPLQNYIVPHLCGLDLILSITIFSIQRKWSCYKSCNCLNQINFDKLKIYTSCFPLSTNRASTRYVNFLSNSNIRLPGVMWRSTQNHYIDHYKKASDMSDNWKEGIRIFTLRSLVGLGQTNKAHFSPATDPL